VRTHSRNDPVRIWFTPHPGCYGGHHVGHPDRSRSHHRRTSFSLYLGAWSKTE
jgi:hypothetical protein